MIGTLANPKVSFPLVGMVALIIFAATSLLGPVLAQVNLRVETVSVEEQALTNPEYYEPFDRTIALPAAGIAGTPVLVRTAHGSRHGDVRGCFQSPNNLLFYVEAGSGRVHVICKVSEGEFYDLIVKDRRAETGYIEEVTVFKVNQYPSVTDFIRYLTSRLKFPCTQFVDDWLEAAIRFVFLQ